jgi:hypothetical protein
MKVRTIRQALALLTCAAVMTTGCGARLSHTRTAPAPPQASARSRVDPALIADVVRQIPVGARVRVVREGGGTISGTLMRRDSDPILIQRRTRVPEAPAEVPIREIVAVELDKGTSTARAVGIAIGAAAAAQLSVWLILAAIYAD